MRTSGHEAIHPDPDPSNPFYNDALPGLTKREYFAAIALQGLCANGNIHELEIKAVICADKLIEELNKNAK